MISADNSDLSGYLTKVPVNFLESNSTNGATVVLASIEFLITGCSKDFSLTENDKGFIVNHDFKWIDLKDLKSYDFRPKILIDILQSDNKVFNHLVFNNLSE